MGTWNRNFLSIKSWFLIHNLVKNAILIHTYLTLNDQRIIYSKIPLRKMHESISSVTFYLVWISQLCLGRLQVLQVYGFGNLQKDELQSVSLEYYQQVEEPQLRRESQCVFGE